MATDRHEPEQGWPFAITRSVRTGFQIVVAPDFLVDSGQHDLLADAAGGEVSDDAVYRREYRDRGSDRLWLLYRVVYLKGDDVGQGDDFDRHDRRTPLIEGVVCRTRPGIAPTDELFASLHALCTPTLRRFYLEDSEIFPVHGRGPIDLPEAGRTLQVEEQNPYESERNLEAALRGRHPQPRPLPTGEAYEGAGDATGLARPGGAAGGGAGPVRHGADAGHGGQGAGQGRRIDAEPVTDHSGGRRRGGPSALITGLAVVVVVLLIVLLVVGLS
ncbi:hypothetical protein ACIP9H_00890 [Streptomyces sp. NPDC088732]|uniref:hypothetical protein n=1 Tax=Streptomyces sp. NPDC088732 TaxID=3365879 RepID=UPI003826EE66